MGENKTIKPTDAYLTDQFLEFTTKHKENEFAQYKGAEEDFEAYYNANYIVDSENKVINLSETRKQEIDAEFKKAMDKVEEVNACIKTHGVLLCKDGVFGDPETQKLIREHQEKIEAATEKELNQVDWDDINMHQDIFYEILQKTFAPYTMPEITDGQAIKID